MKNRILSLSLITIISFVTSCENNSSIMLPSATGKAGEVLIVIDKQVWEDSVGEKFQEILLDEYPLLPIAEPLFDPINIPHQAFASIFKTHRNIILTNISDSVKKNKITIQKNLWADTQLIISITAKNETELIKLLDENKINLIEYIEQAERDRIIINYKQYEKREIGEKLRKKHNISLVIPAGYIVDIDTSNFIWISHETPMISQGILIYYYDYTDTNTFTVDYLVKQRNKFLKQNVPGPTDGSYMITATGLQPELREFMLNNKYTAELRGLWEVENDFMGGPFISFSTVDEKRNRIVTVDTYVYAIKYNKRNYIRQLEAILYTLQIVD